MCGQFGAACRVALGCRRAQGSSCLVALRRRGTRKRRGCQGFSDGRTRFGGRHRATAGRSGRRDGRLRVHPGAHRAAGARAGEARLRAWRVHHYRRSTEGHRGRPVWAGADGAHRRLEVPRQHPAVLPAKALGRAGVPIHSNTVGDLFLRAAEQTEPLYNRLLELVRLEEYVRADETL